MAYDTLRVGVAGLGEAATEFLPDYTGAPRVRLVGAADQRAAARERFEAEIKGKAYEVIPDSKHWRERARELEGDVVFGTLPQGSSL